MTRAWLLPVGAALAAPLVTWLPMLAHRFPALGMLPYQPAFGIDAWQLQVFWFAAIATVAVLVGREDRYLALALVMAGLAVFWRGAMMNPTHTIIFAFGCLMLAAVRYIPKRHHARIVSLLVAWGVFQAVYALQQGWLKQDLLWGPLLGGVLKDHVQPLGTLGTVDALGAYVAILAPLMPWWLLPVAIAGVFVTKSIGATAALGMGLLVRYRQTAWRYPLLVGAVGATVYAVLSKSHDTIWSRLIMQDFGLRHALVTNPVLGLGLGGWQQQVPAQQVARQFAPSREVFSEAHNEPIQWLAELGLVGLVLLTLWLWDHRAMFLHPTFGGSLAALAVSCQTFFPLHMVSTALLGLLLIGMATPADDSSLSLDASGGSL